VRKQAACPLAVTVLSLCPSDGVQAARRLARQQGPSTLPTPWLCIQVPVPLRFGPDRATVAGPSTFLDALSGAAVNKQHGWLK
jgi:hypothetical protein